MIDRLLFTIKGIREALMRCALLSVFSGILIVMQALFLTTSLTGLWYGRSLLDQAVHLLGFALCFVTRQLLENVRSHYLESFASRRADELRNALFEKLFEQGRSLVQQNGTGSFTTLLVEGVDQVESYLRTILPRMAKLVIVPVLILVPLFAFDWVSALIALLVFPAIILQMVLIGHTARQEAGKQHREYMRLANHFIDSIRGIDTLKLFGRNERQADRIFESSERFRTATMKTLRVATLSGAVLDAFSTISIAAIAVMLGFRLVDGSLTLFPALFVLVVIPDYFKPIREFASDYHASLDGKNSLKSILDVLETNASSTPDVTPLHADRTLSDPFTMEVHAISFAYANTDDRPEDPSGSYALKNVSATFSSNQIVGIVGPSGSGKSTFAHLLAGLTEPSSGDFTLSERTPDDARPSSDDRKGLDIDTSFHTSSLRSSWWQKHVVYIPQNPHIFHATLKENVAFYRSDATDEEVMHICSLVGLASLVSELPQGIDTVIGEGGHSLSGGQTQRIAFARAFLHSKCKVLIFDEPTAHLDIETELELKEHMLSLMKGKLVFFATHRLHWLSAMDTVLFLNKGELIAQGSPSKLMQIEAFSSFALKTSLNTKAASVPSSSSTLSDRRRSALSTESSPISPLDMRTHARVFGSRIDSEKKTDDPPAAPEHSTEEQKPDTSNKGEPISWKKDAWVRPYLVRYRKTLLLAVSLGALSVAFAAALMFTAGWLISASAQMPYSILLLGTPLLCVRVFGIGKPLLQYAERLTSHDWVLRMTSDLRVRLYRAFDSQGIFFHSLYRLGDAMGLLAEDVGHLQNLYLRTIFPTVIALMVGTGLVIGFGMLTWWMGLLILCLLSVELFIVPLVSASINGARLAKRKSMKSSLYTEVTDDVMGITDWILSGRLKDYRERHERTWRVLRKLETTIHTFNRRKDVLLQTLFVIGAIAIIVWAALTFSGQAGENTNWILAFSLGYFPLIDAFAPLSPALSEARSHLDSIERLNALPHASTSTHEKEPRSHHVPQRDPHSRSSLVLPVDPSLVFEDVVFSYPGSASALIDTMNLTIEKGEKVAILGKSGAGKSTLISLARGDLIPRSGSVLLRSSDLSSEIPTCALHDKAPLYFGVIQQRTYLFNATLRENLAIGDANACDEKLLETLHKVGLGDLLHRLDNGLDTMVDEAGLRFSGGERHRIALARVLLQDAPIIVLDEPMVGLDPSTENQVLESIFETLKDKTIIMVTHHLQGAMNMDRILFLEDGILKLNGTPAELQRSSNHFRKLLSLEKLSL